MRSTGNKSFSIALLKVVLTLRFRISFEYIVHYTQGTECSIVFKSTFDFHRHEFPQTRLLLIRGSSIGVHIQTANFRPALLAIEAAMTQGIAEAMAKERKVSTLISTSERPPLSPGAAKLITICCIFTPMAILAVFLRTWARRITKQRFVLNDWLILAALVFNCGQSVLLVYASVANGVGYHLTELLDRWPDTAPQLLKSYVAAEPLWITTNTLVKMSILAFYMTVFSSSKPFRISCYGMIALILGYWMSTIVRMYFLCHPFAAAWDPQLLTTVSGAFCVNLGMAYISVSIINLILDLAIFLLPMPLLWGLQMPLKKRILLMGIFGLGFW